MYLQFVLHVMLFRMLNMFCAFTFLLSEVRVQCPIWLLFSDPWFHYYYYYYIRLYSLMAAVLAP
jgi:hypothetical protein